MKRVSPRHAFLGLLLCGAIAYLAVSIKAGSRSAPAAQAKKPAPTNAEVARADQGPVDVRLPEEAEFSSYQGMIVRNIFAPPGLKPASGKEGLTVPPFQPTPNPQPSGPSKPKPPDLSGWSYVGYMTIGDQKIGVLQNEGNDSMQELTLGGEFMGAKVQDINSDEMVFTSPGGPVTLSTPRDFPVVSLDASAAGTPSQTPRQRPGQPPAGPPPG